MVAKVGCGVKSADEGEVEVWRGSGEERRGEKRGGDEKVVGGMGDSGGDEEQVRKREGGAGAGGFVRVVLDVLVDLRMRRNANLQKENCKMAARLLSLPPIKEDRDVPSFTHAEPVPLFQSTDSPVPVVAAVRSTNIHQQCTAKLATSNLVFIKNHNQRETIAQLISLTAIYCTCRRVQQYCRL